MSLRQLSINAFKWNVVDQVAAQALGLVFNILLLRMVSPHDFGLFAVPFVIVLFLRTNQDLGYSSYLVHADEPSHAERKGIFSIIVIAGIVSVAIGLLIAYVLPWWTQESSSSTIMAMLTLSLLAGIFGFIPESIFRKNLDFRTLAVVNLTATLLSGVISLILAYYGFGYMSLVYKYVLYILIASVLFAVVGTKVRLSTKADYSKVGDHMRYTLPLIMSSNLNYVSRNIDTFFLGRYVSSHSLGIYDRSYKIMLLPLQQVSATFSKVLFPTLSKVKDSDQKVSSTFALTTQFIAMVTFPLMGAIYVFAEDIVYSIIGEQWVGMIPILKVFAIIGALQSITTLVGEVFKAKGENALFLKINMIVQPFIFLAIIAAIMISRDILVVAYSYAFVSLLSLLPTWYYTLRVLKSKASEIFYPLVPFAIATGIAIGLILLLKGLLQLETSIGSLVIYAIVYGVCYLSILLLTQNRTLYQLRDILSEITNK